MQDYSPPHGEEGRRSGRSRQLWQHVAVSGSNLDLLPAHERRRLLASGLSDVEVLARRRLEGEPLQYLEGTAPFLDFEVVVDRRVLIPRPETEHLFELALSLADGPSVVVDLGTGSGVLALAAARAFPRAAVHAVDVDAGALAVAGENARRLGVSVELHHGDLFDPLPSALRGVIDLVVSNPPYVADGEWPSLPVDVRHEPPVALMGGHDGTEVLKRIAGAVREWVRPNGLVVCEMGEEHGRAMREAFGAIGSVSIHQDPAGRDRYVAARVSP